MDLTDIVINNFFLKTAFQSGFPEKVGLVKLILGPDSMSNICLEIRDKPSVEIKKWGAWNEDYNALLLYFYGEIDGATVTKFDSIRNCTISISCGNGIYFVKFIGKNVLAEIKFKDIFYEKSIPVFYSDYQ